ncbi:MAG: histidine kinase N-terminal 7TM domain-containing protein, partial [Dehalococcoidales bacterium]|nr:histidine kinase N-terminal 7TM domain-containing protein [Dehalococcoidales bacterium]
MNIQSLISLLAGLAYIPLFIVVGTNRPWQRQKKFFALFLVSMMLWSFGGSLFRSDYLIDYKIFLAKIVLCFLLLGITNMHYFLQTYYDTNTRSINNLLVYLGFSIVLMVIIFLIPQSISIDGVIFPVYGPWVYVMTIYGFGLLGYDIYVLGSKLRSTVNPVVHNQLIYLTAGVGIAVIFTGFSATTLGQQYPWAQVGNLLMALLMTYAVLKHHLLVLRLVLRRGLTIR